MAAYDKKSLKVGLNTFFFFFLEKPVLLEVFTEMSHDAKVLYDFYALSKPTDIKQKGKEAIKSVLGQKKKKKLKNMFGK